MFERPTSRAASYLAAALILCSVLGCGGSASPEANAPDVESNQDAHHRRAADEVSVSAEIGALPVEETEYAFKQAFKEIQRCFTDSLNQLEFIGGEIAVKLLVDTEGQIKHVFAERSTIGHDGTEQCMFNALRDQSWPKPVGGLTGIAQNAFAFEMTGDVRPPVDWTEADIQEALDENSGALAECKGGARGVVATLYVDTTGSALGVGISGSDERVEAARACLVRILSAAVYPSPGSWPAKVSVQL